MTKEEIIAAIQECARKVGQTPSLAELTTMSHVTQSQVRRHFGHYSRAVREAGLERRPGGGGARMELEDLFLDWAEVVRATKKLPTVDEYERLSKYSASPLKRRFGGWVAVPRGLRAYMERRGWTEEWQDVMEIIKAQYWNVGPARSSWRADPDDVALAKLSGEVNWTQEAGMLDGRPVYGPPIRPYPMAFGPTNEQGVAVLFGGLAERLGFVITRVQQGFPDCEALRPIGGDKLQMVRIEFEYESRNFLQHMHEASKCDIIVCWINNWPECPLEVIELRKVVAGIGTSGDRA